LIEKKHSAILLVYPSLNLVYLSEINYKYFFNKRQVASGITMLSNYFFLSAEQ